MGPPVAGGTNEDQVKLIAPPDIKGTESGQVPMDIQQKGEERAKLDTLVNQCSGARKAAGRAESASITMDENFGKRFRSDPETVGTLNPPGDQVILKTFHGARVSRGNTVVNQVVSMSFDPATLKCLCCSTQHKIFSDNVATPIILSDQNFVTVWNSEKGECIPVIRIENGTLHELVDFVMEVFDRDPPPSGSFILLGSPSYLHKVGTQSFCHGWSKVVCRLNKKWPNVNVGPLIPIIRESVPGGVARELIEFAAWLARVYDGLGQGMSSCWGTLVIKLMEKATGHTQLTNIETYTVTLPVSLDPNSGSSPLTFCTNSSRPSILERMEQEQIGELLGSISTTLEKDFGIDIRTDPANVTVPEGTQVQKVVLVGASILKKTTGYMRAEGVEVVDMCVPGWSLTPENVAELTGRLRQLDNPSPVVYVLDLFGNSIFRFIDFDGTVSRPYKRDGHYHMPGEVTVVGEEVQHKLIQMAAPIWETVAGKHCIIMAPTPRYLFHKCCGNTAHCTNVEKDGHPEHFLKEVMQVRTRLKRSIAPGSHGKLWVSDSCEVLKGPAGLTAAERAAALREVSATDGVHFSEAGYFNLATNVLKCAQDLVTGKIGNGSGTKTGSASLFAAGGGRRYFWHGFSSATGSDRGDERTHRWKSDRSKGPQKFNPYGGKRTGGWN